MDYELFEENKEIIAEIGSNFLETNIPISEKNKKRKKQIEIIINCLTRVLKKEEDNPFFSEIRIKIKKINEKLSTILTFYQMYVKNPEPLKRLSNDVVTEINQELTNVLNGLQA